MMAKTVLKPIQAYLPHDLFAWHEQYRLKHYYNMTRSKYYGQMLHDVRTRTELEQHSPSHESSRRKKKAA